MQPPRNPRKTARESIAHNIIRKTHKTPLSFYKISSYVSDTTSNPNFTDTLIIMLTFIAFAAAFPFYPYIIILVLLIVLFYLTQYNPFLGLVMLIVFIFPMIIYQTPAFAWVFMFAITASLIYGYMHHRSIIFAYLLFALAFSQLGYILFFPILTISVLIVGYKRSIILSVLVIFSIVAFAGVSGISNSGYILYNSTSAHLAIIKGSVPLNVINYTIPNKQIQSLSGMLPALAKSSSIFSSNMITININDIVTLYIGALGLGYLYIVETVIFAITLLTIDTVASASRSRYKGTKASIISIIFPLTFVLLSYNTINPTDAEFAFMSFFLAPAFIYILEFFNFKVVKSLDVKKQDVRMKFGEAFEDLSAGDSHETFDDIGNYDATKKELREAIINPIEQRGISKAYSIKPSKGLLLFGPPGTGKTMMMRALANDIHGGFFLVKTPNLVSAFPGETERTLSRIFDTARKNAPCVLLFDEIDSLAKNRNMPDVDEVHRQALSQLLVEIDGFVKLERVIVVGATNMPNLIDPALLRPGRLDKLIYMPLPDFNGRKKIFKIYLSKMPLASDVNIDELAESTERYSGADIKAVCESVAQIVGQDALMHHKVLEVTQNDIMNVITATKPSTTLSQLEEYNKFRIDFERSLHEEKSETKKQEIGLEDIIGLEDAKKAVVEAVQIPLMHPDLIKRYDIKPINGVLLFGPPGTGKTMFMKAVANEMKGVTVLQINGEDMANSDVEGTIATMKEIFNRARENIPSIILIDEIDSIIPKREGASEKSILLTGTLLQEIDGLKEFSGIVIIAATNRPDALDPAILRPGRFDKLLYIRPPNDNERALLFRDYLSKVPKDEGINFDALASETKGFTGADIANVCREAKTKALEEAMKSDSESEVTEEMLEGIIKNTKPSAPESLISTYMSFLLKYGSR
ncbi:MAG: AAA family ATPase [Candidatus Micrarchaeia archaeon]